MSPQLLLQRLVEMAGGPEGEGYILALASEGMGALPDTLQSGKVKYAVCQPETELALRRRVWQAGGAPFIALVPQDLAERLPPDLLRRARRARVHALDAADILSIALGAQVVGVDDPAVRQLALDHIDALRERLGSRGETLPTAVDALLLDELLMEVLLGRRLRGTSAAALLAELLERPAIEDPGVIELLRRQLPRRFGAEGLVLAWALPSGERLRALIERGVLLAIDEAELPQTVWGPLAAALAPDAIALPKPLLRRTVARLAEAALEPLGARASAYLAAAEQVGREILVPSIIGRSLLLPLGLENQANQLAKRAASGGSIDSD
ncbi:MAG: hypothetical protein H6648_11595, partial [Caldilineae bacterium]|nr:hypothetical protein [Caldilineae bacterium]